MKRRSILIVSATAGTGHLRAGDAMLRAVAAEYPEWRVEHVDVLSLALRWVKTAYAGGFELVAARAPQVWRGAYWLADGSNPDQARWAGVARRLLFRAFERVLTSASWDHVICTHFLPAQLAAGRSDFPRFSLIVTDFHLHKYWVQPRVDQYFVATDAVADTLHERLPQTRVAVTGIPIDAAFSAEICSGAAKARLGFDSNRPVALIMGGGLGIGVHAAATTLLEHAPADVQLAVVCGRNHECFAQLMELDVARTRLKCFGYVDNMPELYAASDLVVTKPGGLSCSEALAMYKPVLLTRAIPGHEEGNVKALQAAGAALSVPTKSELIEVAQKLFADPAELTRMSANARAFGRPHAARAIVDAVAQTLPSEVAA